VGGNFVGTAWCTVQGQGDGRASVSQRGAARKREGTDGRPGRVGEKMKNRKEMISRDWGREEKGFRRENTHIERKKTKLEMLILKGLTWVRSRRKM